MNCPGTRSNGSRYDGGNIQVAVFKLRRPNADTFIRKVDVQRITVCFRKNSDCGNSHFFAGTDDANSDFAAVSN